MALDPTYFQLKHKYVLEFYLGKVYIAKMNEYLKQRIFEREHRDIF